MRAVSLVCVLTVCSLVLLGKPGDAAAQEPRSQDEPYFAPELMLGVDGSAEATLLNVSGSDDLKPTFGFGVKYMHPLHRYFVLGGQFSVLWWNTRAFEYINQDRSLLMDIAVVPQGRLPVTNDIELTLGLPVGLALDFFGANAVTLPGGVLSGDVGTGFGFNVALLFGARFALSEDIGLVTELGYAMHSVSHSADVVVLGVPGSTDFDISLGQPVLQVGVSF